MKNASILLSSKKNQLFSPWAGHVRTAASHVTCRKHITRGIQRVRHSLPLLIIYSCLNLVAACFRDLNVAGINLERDYMEILPLGA